MPHIPNFYSGLSGLQLPIPKYQYPLEFQNTSRLTYYATFFNSIEVNSSFYTVPMIATVERWALSVHEKFRFTFKLFKEITHNKNLNFDSALVEKFITTITRIGIKSGCLLVQFPPSLKKENIYQLDKLLHDIQLADPSNIWNVAVEFRDKGWYNDDVYQVLESRHASLVMHDIPASASPNTTILSNIIYVRFHGPTGNYGGSYTEAFLMEYAAYIRDWLTEGKTVYVYFNNTKGDAFNNLATLNNFVVPNA
jgi:uncharacterized protein YecE (DUF72 family)